MNFSLVHLVIALVGVILAWLGFNERRMQTMYSQLQSKIEDKQEVNRVIQNELKEQLSRLDAKIDMLIQLQLNNRNKPENS